MSFLAQQKAEMQATQIQVQLLLQWSDAQYAQYVYERGLEYLAAYLNEDKQGQRLLEGQQLFWNWWKNEFHYRNLEYVQVADTMVQDELLEFYHMVNNAFDLIHEIRPSRNIVGNAFATVK